MKMIKVSDLVKALNLDIVSGKIGLENVVTGAYVSDLLSDVMGNANSGQVWITLQTHRNILAVASLKELSAIIIVKGLTPDKECIEKSEEENIPVLVTTEETFVISGRIYELLKKNLII